LGTIHRTKRRQSNNITRKTKTLTNTEPMKTEGEPTCSLSTIFLLNFATIPTVWYDVWYNCVVRRVVRLCGTTVWYDRLVRHVVRLCGTTCGTTVWYDVWYDCVVRQCGTTCGTTVWYGFVFHLITFKYISYLPHTLHALCYCIYSQMDISFP
jgi:hypothetical protein